MNHSMYQRLFDFNHWANNLYLESFQYNNNTPVSCLQAMSHIIGAETIWLQRINHEPVTPSAFDLKNIEELTGLNILLTEKWKEKISALSESDFYNIITYKSLDGIDFSSSLEDIFIHVCNHGTYHRAQIAQSLKAAGIKIPPTDYIVFTRS
jgi:uncharacterized damage-inducible protein DinB